MKAFEQGLEKKRIKQRNHKFNFSGAEILIAILCLWHQNNYIFDTKTAQYFLIPWRMWKEIKLQMRQLFHLQIKKVCCFSGEQILAMIVFYLILRTKTIIANSHQKYLINEKFDAFIGNYFDLSAFKLGFQNQQFIGTDLWDALKAAILKIICNKNLNHQTAQNYLTDLVPWFETRLLNYQNYFEPKSKLFKCYKNHLKKFSNYCFLIQIYQFYDDFHFSIKNSIHLQWISLFKPTVNSFINQTCFNNQYDRQKMLKIFYFYLIENILHKLRKSILVVHEFVPNQRKVITNKLLEIFKNCQIKEMNWNDYYNGNDQELQKIDIVILFANHDKNKTTKNVIHVENNNFTTHRIILNFELFSKVICFFFQKSIFTD